MRQSIGLFVFVFSCWIVATSYIIWTYVNLFACSPTLRPRITIYMFVSFLSFHSNTMCTICESASIDRLARSFFPSSFTLIFYMTWIQCICLFIFYNRFQLHILYDMDSMHLLIHLLQPISTSYSIWHGFNAFAYSLPTVHVVDLTRSLASYLVSNGDNRSADSFYTANVVRLSTTISTSYCIWNEFNVFAYSLSTASVVGLTRSSTSYCIWHGFNAFAYSLSTTSAVRRPTTISTSYCIWNEFNLFADSFFTVNIVRLVRVSTSYWIWKLINPCTDSFSTTNVVRLTRSSLSYSIRNVFNRFADSFPTTSAVRRPTTISTSYCIWNGFNLLADSFSTTNVVRLTHSSLSYMILNVVNLSANTLFGF